MNVQQELNVTIWAIERRLYSYRMLDDCIYLCPMSEVALNTNTLLAVPSAKSTRCDPEQQGPP